MWKGMLFGGAAGALLALPVLAEETRREMGAHEHGHGTLNIAIEGRSVAMELIVPGMDIVGFEHEATTDEQKAAIERAEATLRRPLDLFVPPERAGCRVEQATIELESEDEHDEHHDEHHDEAAEHKGEMHADEEHAEEEASHTEFHVSYALACDDPDALSGITFAYFETFPGAEELEVTVIGERGQTRYEVNRDTPRIDLKGLI